MFVKVDEKIVQEVVMVLSNTSCGTSYKLEDGRNKTIAELFLQLLGALNAAYSNSEDDGTAGV